MAVLNKWSGHLSPDASLRLHRDPFLAANQVPPLTEISKGTPVITLWACGPAGLRACGRYISADQAKWVHRWRPTYGDIGNIPCSAARAGFQTLKWLSQPGKCRPIPENYCFCLRLHRHVKELRCREDWEHSAWTPILTLLQLVTVTVLINPQCKVCLPPVDMRVKLRTKYAQIIF